MSGEEQTATATEEEDKESDHVTVPTNQIAASNSLESIQTPSVSSLLTQPEGEGGREGGRERGSLTFLLLSKNRFGGNDVTSKTEGTMYIYYLV